MSLLPLAESLEYLLSVVHLRHSAVSSVFQLWWCLQSSAGAAINYEHVNVFLSIGHSSTKGHISIITSRPCRVRLHSTEPLEPLRNPAPRIGLAHGATTLCTYVIGCHGWLRPNVFCSLCVRVQTKNCVQGMQGVLLSKSGFFWWISTGRSFVRAPVAINGEGAINTTPNCVL